MKKLSLALVGTIICGLLSGCLVRSVNPWLPDATKVAVPSLVGAWQDDTQKLTAVFSQIEGTNYQIRTVSEDNKTAAFSASLHKVDDALPLVVGPPKQEGLGAFTLIPAYLLFKVEWTENSMNLFPLDINSIEARLRNSPIESFASGNKENGVVLFAATPALTAFVRSQLTTPEFFTIKPLYQFTRLVGDSPSSTHR